MSAYEIQRRDLKTTFRVFPQKRHYQRIPILEMLTTEELAKFQSSGRHWNARYGGITAQPTSGNYRIIIEHHEISDQTEMFGCLARRWKVTNKDERLQEDLYSSTETITDAWYLDPVATTKRYAGFSPSLIRRGFCDVSSNGQTPLIEVRGDAPEGLCAKAESKTTSYLRLRNGEIREESSIQNSRIMSLSEETFEAKLFEPPTNYRQIPVYPSRFTMAQSDIRRSLTLMWYRLRLRQAR